METEPAYQWPGTPDPSLSIPTPCEQHRSDLGSRSVYYGGKLYCKETSISKECQEIKRVLEKEAVNYFGLHHSIPYGDLLAGIFHRVVAKVLKLSMERSRDKNGLPVADLPEPSPKRR